MDDKVNKKIGYQEKVEKEKMIKEILDGCNYGELVQVFSMILCRLNKTLNIRESKIQERERKVNIKRDGQGL
jgi:hypothetical protein